jgi:hypothetical protein
LYLFSRFKEVTEIRLQEIAGSLMAKGLEPTRYSFKLLLGGEGVIFQLEISDGFVF